jgi:hypothetical protein
MSSDNESGAFLNGTGKVFLGALAAYGVGRFLTGGRSEEPRYIERTSPTRGSLMTSGEVLVAGIVVGAVALLLIGGCIAGLVYFLKNRISRNREITVE